METASPYTFIRTLVFIMAAYYIFKFVARLLFPMLVRKAVEHAQDNMREQFNQYKDFQNNSYRKPDGDVTIDVENAPKQKETKKVGEYIDYEEIG